MLPRPTSSAPAHPITFLVVFENRPARGAFALLRRGFRHCFCLRRESSGWLLCDPRSDRLDLCLIPPLAALDLARAYASLGATVLGLRLTPQAHPPRRRWLAPLTCVEIVKRTLGRDLPGIHTPWALYRTLRAWPETTFLSHALDSRC